MLEKGHAHVGKKGVWNEKDVERMVLQFLETFEGNEQATKMDLWMFLETVWLSIILTISQHEHRSMQGTVNQIDEIAMRMKARVQVEFLKRQPPGERN